MSQPQFTKHARIQRRKAKVSALASEGTPEARKARKAMNEHLYRSGRTNLNGFYGDQKVRGKEKRKTRKVRNSKPFISLIKAGY